MKFKILHILGDNKLGGVRSYLESWLDSQEFNEFNFLVSSIADAHSILHTWKPDIVLIHYACSWSRLPQLIYFRQRAKVIILEHNYCEGFTKIVPSLARFHFMLKLSYCLSNRVVAVSQAQGEWMLRKNLVYPKKLTVIQQCRSLDDFFPITPKPVKPPLILAAYGRFCTQKGFDVLLQVMNLIPHVPVKLYIGGEGSQENELKQLAQGLDNVKFFGRIDDVPGFLQECDAVVIPSRWEPWGYVCLEAKAAGKPVIVSNVDGLTEQVTDCGIVVSSENPQQLAQVIKIFSLLPKTQLEVWGYNGRESVRESWNKYLTQWKTLFWEMLEH